MLVDSSNDRESAGHEKDSVSKIITNLGVQKVFAIMMPTLPNDDQKKHRIQMNQDIIEYIQSEPELLCRVITGDETLILELGVY